MSCRVSLHDESQSVSGKEKPGSFESLFIYRPIKDQNGAENLTVIKEVHSRKYFFSLIKSTYRNKMLTKVVSKELPILIKSLSKVA